MDTLVRWDEVKVTCSSDPTKDERFENASVVFDGSTAGLTVSNPDRSSLYAKAKLTSLTPVCMEFEACYWSSYVEASYQAYDELIPVKVVCTSPRVHVV